MPEWPSPEDVAADLPLFLAQFEDLPPMPLSEGVQWIQVYLEMYAEAHNAKAPASHLLQMRKEILRASEQYLDAQSKRAEARLRFWSYVVPATGAVISAIVIAVSRLL